jgi:hypothetical protein
LAKLEEACKEQALTNAENVAVDSKDDKCDDEIHIHILSKTSIASLKDRPPFKEIFAQVIVTDSDDAAEATTNSLFNLKAFDVITGVYHLFPLWSAAFQFSVKRLLSEVALDKVTEDTYKLKSNASVESHFKRV